MADKHAKGSFTGIGLQISGAIKPMAGAEDGDQAPSGRVRLQGGLMPPRPGAASAPPSPDAPDPAKPKVVTRLGVITSDR